MDVLEAIFTRKSIRNFTGEPINEEDLKTVLRAGFSAPSAHNTQPWHFVVVRNNLLLEGIAKFHPYGKMMPKAGCGIVVCGDSEKQSTTGFLIEDCSAAMENMLLAAHGLDLGAVWCGLYPAPQLTKPMSELLNLPSTIMPIGIMALGHKNEKREATNRYNDSKVHFDQW